MLDKNSICEWGHENCRNMNDKCSLCFGESFHYRPAIVKERPQRKQQADKRMGGGFEYKNHQNNVALLAGAASNMTPNSGAGKVKGDERISGLINIMEELKTKVTKQIPGKESFTIKREWLTKLKREAQIENMEFFYLKFSFNEHDSDIYIVVQQDTVMDMVATMAYNRKIAKNAHLAIDVAEKRARLKEAENIKLIAEIDLLKAQLELKEHEDKEA